MQTMGLSKLVLVAPQRFPHPDVEALASGATAVLAALRVEATLSDALRGAVMTIGFSARPREFAGSVLAVRAAAWNGEAVEQHFPRGDRGERQRRGGRDLRLAYRNARISGLIRLCRYGLPAAARVAD